MADATVQPVSRPFDATVSPPGSKSLTNRALVIAALADGVSELSNVLFADDTLVMFDGLKKLGFELDVDEPKHSVRVHGRGGLVPNSSAELYCGNSGTTIRFMTALCALGKGTFTLDGNARMRQRPIGTLSGLLKNLGARVEHAPEAEGFPPVKVNGDGLPGGFVRYGAEPSSQYLSAILMVAPYARHEVLIDLAPNQTSWPYVPMTMRLMDHFAVTPELYRDPVTREPKSIHVPQGIYKASDYAVEPDASNATYFLAAAAVNPGSKMTIQNLGKHSLQGDVGFADLLRKMGADLVFGGDFITVMGTDELEGIDIDMSDMPDAAMTLAVVALFAKGTTRISGLHTLLVKETDRIAALSTELQKLGAKVEIEQHTLVIDPPAKPRAAEIATYDDHRMAMSFAVAGTRIEGMVIKDRECVNKTYPQFFEDFNRAIGASAT